jgi:hypothetical protein
MLVLIFVMNIRLPPKASDFRQRRQLLLSVPEGDTCSAAKTVAIRLLHILPLVELGTA